jgi:hypothetical protein
LGIAVDIDRVGKTIAACSPSPIRSFGPSGPPPTAYRLRKRGVFVERVVARLQLQRGFTDADLDDAVRAALTGLIQSAA